MTDHMTDRTQPAYIRDNPIMAGAFAAFMNWAYRQDFMHEQHTADTGLTRPPPPKNGLEAMIDKATGHEDQYAASFVEWAIKTQWGTEEDEGDE